MAAMTAAELLARKVSRPTRSASNVPDESQSRGDGDSCPICAQLAYKKNRKTGQVWVECEQCNTWYHWACATVNPLDSLDSIDKWFCHECVAKSDGQLKTTYKKAQRRSQRTQGTKLDYANLDQHLPADVSKWIKVIATRDIKSGHFKQLTSDQLTKEWIYGDQGMREPFWIKDPEGLEMEMPDRQITIKQIADIVGPDTPLEVIDVASQSSLAHWTLGQWASYYHDPDRDKVRNVISLEVSKSPLGSRIVAPKLVRMLDWVENIWPANEKEPGTYPAVQKYCLMSVKECWTDWHVDFAGSSVFYHVIRGGKVFYFIRPTPENLKAYEQWSGSAEKQENEWLGDSVDCVYKIELQPGNTMIIPTGWIHAVYTPADSLVFGGNFLHSLNIATQLRIYEIEIATKVPRKFRFPYFVRLLWMVADHYTKRLRAIPPSKNRNEWPIELCDRVLDGLRHLSSFLWEQTTRLPKDANVSAERRRIARENVPWHIVPDPSVLAAEFRTRVFKAMDEPLDAKCTPGYMGDPQELLLAKEEHLARTRAAAAAAASSSSSRASPSSAARKNSPIASRRTTPALPAQPTKIAAKTTRDEGDIISRSIVPVTVPPFFEKRVDPTDESETAKEAEVRKTESTTTVVRRLVQDDGSVVLETRTVVTRIERVKWLPSTDEHGDGDTEKVKDEAEHQVDMVDSKPTVNGSDPKTAEDETAVPSEPIEPTPPVQTQEATTTAPDTTTPEIALPDATSALPDTTNAAPSMMVPFDPDDLLSSISATLPPVEEASMTEAVPPPPPVSLVREEHLNGPIPGLGSTTNGLHPSPRVGTTATTIRTQFGTVPPHYPSMMYGHSMSGLAPFPPAPVKRMMPVPDDWTKRPRLDDQTNSSSNNANGM